MKHLLSDSIHLAVNSSLVNLSSITEEVSSVFAGTDPLEGDVPPLHRRPDRSPILEHWERCQQGLQQHWLPLLLHALPYVRRPHAHCTHL